MNCILLNVIFYFSQLQVKIWNLKSNTRAKTLSLKTKALNLKTMT